jgi:hypothetical protein
MRAKKIRKTCLSSPQALLLDSGILIALFSKNPTEQKRASEATMLMSNYPHASRHLVTPCLVELFYKVRKFISPEDVKKNLDFLSITLLPTAGKIENDIFSSYVQINYKNHFDYADYYLCQCALLFRSSMILTIDKDDMPLALNTAQKYLKSSNECRLVSFD